MSVFAAQRRTAPKVEAGSRSHGPAEARKRFGSDFCCLLLPKNAVCRFAAKTLSINALAEMRTSNGSAHPLVLVGRGDLRPTVKF